MISALVTILLIVSILAAAFSCLSNAKPSARFIAWYALALAATLHVVASSILIR